MMAIGAYRHRVTFDDPAGPLDPLTWDCAISSASAQVVDGQSAYFFRGRFHPGVRLETRIAWEGRTFQVLSLTDPDERHLESLILATEVVARGR